MKKQENISQTTETGPNKMKIHHLLNKGFKIVVLKMLTKVTITMHGQNENITKREKKQNNF